MVRRNLTWGDATFRGLFGLVLAILSMDVLILFDGTFRWTVAIVTAVASIAMVATATTGHCPVYRAFGRKTVPPTKGWEN